MPNYSLEDIYCAYRQAKTALYFERRGAGIVEFAEFEDDLEHGLRRILHLINESEALFDNVEFSRVWLVPKKLSQDPLSDDGVVRIGIPPPSVARPRLEVQLRVHPSPELATAEVLYLWQFGHLLDSLLTSSAVGYRLDLRGRKLSRTRRWLFEYWPERYQEFRTAPVNSAKRHLESGHDIVTVISADLASYYDSIQANFLLSANFIGALGEKAEVLGSTLNMEAYQSDTASLLRLYDRFRRRAARITGLPWQTGVPIGALTSRVVANVALASLDTEIRSSPITVSYRRYVDDFVLVCVGSDLASMPRQDILSTVFPLSSETEGRITLDAKVLGRDGSDLHIQPAKLKIHHLRGEAGRHFLQSVGDDFLGLVSERRAFLDDSTLFEGAAAHLARTRRTDGSPLRVLRDADRIRLEHFALSTSLATLERMAVLLAPAESRKASRSAQLRIAQVMDREEDWYAEIDLAFRLLRLALSVGDERVIARILARMQDLWGTTDAIRESIGGLTHQARPITRESAWVALRDYLHARQLEAVVSALQIGEYRSASKLFAAGLPDRTRRIHGRGVRRLVRLMAAADLRMRDREDDRLPLGQREVHEHPFGGQSPLHERFAKIDEYVARCEALADYAWVMPAHRLFLATRPPSYFDIARRWLYKMASSGIPDDAFFNLLDVVNAVRGTEYTDPVASVVDAATVQLPADGNELPDPADWTNDPRIILGNLTSEKRYWEGAATKRPGTPDGHPVLTKERIVRLYRVLQRAKQLSTQSGPKEPRRPSLLILPELSLPRLWLRAVGNHVTRNTSLALVAGLEYLHDASKDVVYNQVIGVFPGPFGSVATWPWTKGLPAREEEVLLAKRSPPLTFGHTPWRRRIVLLSRYGDMSVLICSEIIETRRIADLLGRVEVLAVPSWNTDTSSYDHLVQTVGLQLNAIVAIANNAEYSDCRAWAPHEERWMRDLCRLISRNCEDAIHVDIPLSELRQFRRNPAIGGGFRPLPPDWS